MPGPASGRSLAACRTQAEFASESDHKKMALTEKAAEIARCDRIWLRRPLRRLVYPANTAILLIFQAIVSNVHSPLTAATPRNRNCRKSIADLMMPNTGSTVCLRNP